MKNGEDLADLEYTLSVYEEALALEMSSGYDADEANGEVSPDSSNRTLFQVLKEEINNHKKKIKKIKKDK